MGVERGGENQELPSSLLYKYWWSKSPLINVDEMMDSHLGLDD